MTVPFLVTLALAIKDHRGHARSLFGKVGLAIAILSLGLARKPVNDGIVRSRQSRNMSLKDVAAPPFDTQDIQGTKQRLEDQKGKVVLVNIWATWCEPCRAEMPKLDRLYQERKQPGFIVFGLSDEGVDLQRKFVGQVQ
jgi:thiol-disulfide isomerase/thioredoxin